MFPTKVAKALIGLLLIAAFALVFYMSGAFAQNVSPSECYNLSEYISEVALARDQGRSLPKISGPQEQLKHRNFLVKFVYSSFGQLFDPMGHYQSYLGTCFGFQGDLQEIEAYMRSKMGETELSS